MFHELYGKSFGAFDISLDVYDKEYRNLGIHYEKTGVYCFGCEQEGVSHTLNLHFWKYTLVLMYSKCVCISKHKGGK